MDLNIPNNGEQSRTMAEQSPKQTDQQNKPFSSPEHDFSPLFNNAKNHCSHKKIYPS
jgi:hypothetical protein